MTDDDLRNRLAAANPVPPTEPVDPAGSDRARTLMEDIMSTETVQPRPTRRSYRLVSAVAAVLVVAVGVAAVFTGGREEPLVLSADGGDSMAMCLVYDPAILAEQSVAFGGTVTALSDTTATFEVDRWFTGGDADTVEVNHTPGFEALIGTPALEVGQRYLITAVDGVVNGCGYSGPATPGYEADFEAAFGA